jgi:hypothetical protein
MRMLVTRYRDRRKPIWIIEIGWATAGFPGPATVSPEQQALYLPSTYRELAAARERFNIAGVVWFSLRDTRDTPGSTTPGCSPPASRQSPPGPRSSA